MNGYARSGRLGFPEKRERVIEKIGFVEQDDWASAAFPGESNVALDAAGAKITIDSSDDESRVHVGGDDLLGRGAASGLPRELAATL